MEVLIYVTKLVESWIWQTDNWMMQVKNCLFLLWSQEHCKKIELFLFACCCSGSVVRSWPCEIKGRIPVYFNKIRISFSTLGSHGPSAGSYMAQKCQRCFLWIMLYYTSKPKQLSGARRVLVQSHDNQFQLISCHPGNPQSLPECASCKEDFLVYLSHVKVVFLLLF